MIHYVTEHVCRECGAHFVGGRASKFCDDCIERHVKAQSARHRMIERLRKRSAKGRQAAADIEPDRAATTFTRDGYWRCRPMAGGGAAANIHHQ